MMIAGFWEWKKAYGGADRCGGSDHGELSETEAEWMILKP
jgi:hypothetical protein